ncbi:hypothetical protein [Orientia tsutsugamushi]|uniref:hypothetical protein n=1 Tax=Orientia tsutsugamushi TaxID=784 RepID=UPI000D5A27EF|nr:Uncharacterised protein [Orientia tsutsugamushi]
MPMKFYFEVVLISLILSLPVFEVKTSILTQFYFFLSISTSSVSVAALTSITWLGVFGVKLTLNPILIHIPLHIHH